MSIDALKALSQVAAFQLEQASTAPRKQSTSRARAKLPPLAGAKPHMPLAPSAYVMAAVASIRLGGIGPAVALRGKAAAFGEEKVSAREERERESHDTDTQDEKPVAHDAPERLTQLRAQMSQLSPDLLQQWARLAERTGEHGYGFALETTELPAKPGAQPGSRMRLAPSEVTRALARHGRVFVGKIESMPVSGSNRPHQVVDAASAEAIVSFDGLRSYLALFR